MSLTEFLKNADVREKFNEAFPNQGKRPGGDVQAPPQTTNYPLVGTAFDYLLRFYLRRHIGAYNARQWVAEDGYMHALAYRLDIADEVREIIDEAEVHRDEYLETGTLSRSLIESSLDLARIDGIYRSGREPTNLGEYDDGDIIDCIQLIETLNSSEALTGDVVYLNPAFGNASKLVGGADADVILDGMLVDVKVTKISTFKADYWRQLVGYMTLADIHATLQEEGICEGFEPRDNNYWESLPEITEFGVYFARHGELVTYPAEVVYDADHYPEFRSWFVDAALSEYGTI